MAAMARGRGLRRRRAGVTSEAKLARYRAEGRWSSLDRGGSGVYSERRLRELVEVEWPERRRVVEEAKARDGYRCQGLLVWPHECRGPLVGHEPLKRSQGGDALAVDEVLTVCAWINQLVEEEPAWALEVGLSVRRGVGERWSWTRDWTVAR